MTRIDPTAPSEETSDAPGGEAPAVPAFVWDGERWRIVDANPAAVVFWGEASLIDLLDRPFGPESPTCRTLADAAAAVTGGRVLRRLLQLQTASGLRTVDADVTEAALPDGRIGLRVEVAGAAEAPDERGPLLAVLARALDVPACLFSVDGKLAAKNEAAAELLPNGIDTIAALMGEDGKTRRLVGQALSDGLASGTFRIATRFGPRLARVTLSRGRDPETGMAALAASLHDIADRARAAAQPHAEPAPPVPAPAAPAPSEGAAPEAAETSSPAARALLSRVGHELRTPLNAILGFAEVMAEERFGPIGNAKYAEYARDIRVGGEHLLGLVNDLLELARAENGRRVLDFDAVDLAVLARETADLLHGEADERGIALMQDVPDDIPPVVADARTLRQILINLVGNALKFTDAQGTVTIGLAQDAEGDVVLSVADTGIGMTADEIKAALEPFGQVERAQSGRMRGVGLGLPLSRSLAEANKASFAVESTPGEGTTVRVTFPPTSVLAT